jgi:hypothetical protein
LTAQRELCELSCRWPSSRLWQCCRSAANVSRLWAKGDAVSWKPLMSLTVKHVLSTSIESTSVDQGCLVSFWCKAQRLSSRRRTQPGGFAADSRTALRTSKILEQHFANDRELWKSWSICIFFVLKFPGCAQAIARCWAKMGSKHIVSMCLPTKITTKITTLQLMYWVLSISLQRPLYWGIASRKGCPFLLVSFAEFIQNR